MCTVHPCSRVFRYLWWLRLSNTSLLSIPPSIHLAPVVSVLQRLQSWNSHPFSLLNLYQPWHLPPFQQAFQPFSALLLCLKFGFGWPLCAFTNYIYLLTYDCGRQFTARICLVVASCMLTLQCHWNLHSVWLVFFCLFNTLPWKIAV